MPNDLTRIPAQPTTTAALAAPLASLASLMAEVHEHKDEGRAANTVRAYRADWADFTAWCAAQGVDALPARPEIVMLYVTHLGHRHKLATIERRLVSISVHHEHAHHNSPTKTMVVREQMKILRRRLGAAQTQKAPTLTDDIQRMVRSRPASLLGLRDRALLLIGFAGAFRRSELVALDVADLQFTRAGLRVTIRKSKTDQEGRGRVLGIERGQHEDTCPYRTLQAWLAAAGIEFGPIFRPVNRHGQMGPRRLSDHAVAEIVKRAALGVGLDPTLYAGHSLRAGLATAAAMAGVEERKIMQQTGHKSPKIARRYIRDGEVFRDNASGKVGL